MSERKTSTMAIRDDIETDLLQQVANEVQETILLHVSETWSNQQCEDVEGSILSHTKAVLSALTDAELRSSTALRRHIEKAVGETRAVLKGLR